MTYKTNKFFLAQNTSISSQQIISTTYQEVTGSKCNITLKKTSADFIYKFIFYSQPRYVSSSDYDATFIHIKLQKSNDNFSSNIVDIPGKQLNFSGDTIQDPDHFYNSCNVFFIVEDLDVEYLRLVARSYSTSNRAILHSVDYLDGAAISNAYFNPTLVVAEI